MQKAARSETRVERLDHDPTATAVTDVCLTTQKPKKHTQTTSYNNIVQIITELLVPKHIWDQG